ncbi:MAG: energy-coupling factor transporter transmembrane component T family protein [Candidatus Limnocylindrales bacterium]
MSFLASSLSDRPDAPLARTAGVTRIVAGAIWLVAAVLTTDPLVPASLCAAALLVLVFGSGLSLRRVARRFRIVFLAAIGLSVLAALSSPANLTGAAALGLRLLSIALTSMLVFGPGEPTGLADSLVQQWRVPDRFAYGTIAAFGLAPLLAADWAATRAARRLRGMEPAGLPARLASVGGRLLVLLVTAIRRAERMGLSMDARGFDGGMPRSRYRPVRLGAIDLMVLVGAIAVAAAALTIGRVL